MKLASILQLQQWQGVRGVLGMGSRSRSNRVVERLSPGEPPAPPVIPLCEPPNSQRVRLAHTHSTAKCVP